MIKSDNSQGYPKPPDLNFPIEKLTEIVTERLRNLSITGDFGDYITIEHQRGISDLFARIPVNPLPGTGLILSSRFEIIDELQQCLVQDLNQKNLFRIVILLSGEFDAGAMASFFTSISSVAELEYFEKTLFYNELINKLTLLSLRIKNDTYTTRQF